VEDSALAVRALTYMLLASIMLHRAADVPAIISGKLALKYAGRGLEALQAVATASLHRSLAEFEKCLTDYPSVLREDSIISTHLDAMYDTLLQQNLARIVEPYSRVEVAHVAATIALPQDVVENKLSMMILDGQLDGILDQGEGCLEIFDHAETDKTYAAALQVMEHTGHVVEPLYKKAQHIL